MKEIILMGGGGHCKSVIDAICSMHQEFDIVGIIDLEQKVGPKVCGIPIIGTEEDLDRIFERGVKYALVTVGSVGDTSIRQKLYNKAKKIGFHFPVIVDSTAVVSGNAYIEEGTFIGKNVVINTDVKIGANCIINTSSTIEHDCVIGDFCHIAPGAVLCGEVKIGNKTHIGTNSTVIQCITIGCSTVIGAGSVVVKDIRSGVKAYGNPCREII